MSAISDWVGVHDADVVLITRTAQAFAAAQSARLRLATGSQLPEGLIETASSLGDEAALGRLVLFLGAGIGFPAGLPLWGDLLARLATDAKMTPAEIGGLEQLDALDAARIIESRLGSDPERLGRAIAGYVRATSKRLSGCCGWQAMRSSVSFGS